MPLLEAKITKDATEWPMLTLATCHQLDGRRRSFRAISASRRNHAGHGRGNEDGREEGVKIVFEDHAFYHVLSISFSRSPQAPFESTRKSLKTRQAIYYMFCVQERAKIQEGCDLRRSLFFESPADMALI